MKSVLFGVTVLALVATAACNRNEDKAENGSTGGNGQVVQNGSPGVPTDPQAAFQARHEGFERMGKSFKALNRELKGDAPNLDVVRLQATVVADSARQIPNWFPAGSGPEAVPRTRAKAEIWSNGQDFQQRAQNFIQAASAFVQTAQGSDVAAIQGALPGLGNSCKECHDRYRGEER